MDTQWMVSGWTVLKILLVEITVCGAFLALLLWEDGLNKPKPKKKSKDNVVFKRSDNYPFE